MIYLLFGPDTYRSRRRVLEIVSEFEKKAGPPAGRFNVTRTDAVDEPEKVLLAGRTASLFAEKELTIIERVSESGENIQEHVRRQLENWQSDRRRTVIFWEEAEKPKDAILKAIRKAATKSQEFAALPPASLGHWIDTEASRRSIPISLQEKRLLQARFGPDLWAIASELDKMRDGWVTAAVEEHGGHMWDFTDAFFSSRQLAFRPLTELLEAGHDVIYLLGALAASLRTLALVWHATRGHRKTKMPGGIHPFVVRKNTVIAQHLNADDIRHLFLSLVQADVELKTGKLPAPLPLVKLVLR